MELLSSILPLLLAYVLDRLLGDPACLPHLVVAFGRAIAGCEHAWTKDDGKWRALSGVTRSRFPPRKYAPQPWKRWPRT